MTGAIIFLVIFLFICSVVIIIELISLLNHIFRHKKRIKLSVNKLIIYFSLVLIIISFLWDFNFLRYKNAIPHEQWETITFNDFRGLKKPFSKLDGGAHFAYVHTSISIDKDKNKIQIQSLFHPCRSYVFNKKLYENKLLTHELYHFHITECAARLIRKEAKELLKANEEIDLTEIKRKRQEKEYEMQMQYDDDTYHGYLYGKQIEWQQKIDSILVSLNSYSNSIITLEK